MGGMPSNWFETIVLHCWETWRENSHRPASSCLELDFPAENLGIFGVFWGSMLVWRIRWVDECIRMLQGWGGHEWKELSSLILMTPAAMQLGVVQQDEEVGHLTNEMQSAKSHHLEDAKAYSQQISTDAIGQLGLDLIGQVVPRTSAAGMKQVAREVELHHACHNHVSINKPDRHLSGTREWGQAGTVDGRALPLWPVVCFCLSQKRWFKVGDLNLNCTSISSISYLDPIVEDD